MHRFGLFVVLVIVAVLSLAPATAQDSLSTLEYDGFDRTYTVRLPDDYDENISYPVVIVLHGAGGDGLNLQINTQIDELAAQYQYIAVFPDGVQRGWNFLDEEQMAQGDLYTDDVGFLDALIDQLQVDYNVDAGRIFLAGYSNGALLTIRAGCDLASRLSGIAIVAGMYSFELIEHCQDAELIPTMLIWGSEDDVFPSSGYVLVGQDGRVRTSISYIQTRTFMATRFGCGTQVEPRYVETAASPFQVLEERYIGCDSGVPAVFYAIVGQNHSWPERARFTFLDARTTGNMEETIYFFFNNIRRPDVETPENVPALPEVTPEATSEIMPEATESAD